ncbi:MAG TPA: outer membrane lipoprotein carrier protein LolA [Pararhizobium sp.]|nr:outer membrane lipoprotein carrier protein LolA [Pararhizobium sp.]
MNKLSRTGRMSGNPLRLLSGALFALGLALSLPLAGTVAAQTQPAAASGTSVAQQIANHFSSVKTMTGDFVQIGPAGQQSGGTFFIERPGKIRFNYDASSPLKVISNGQSVAIGNTKLGTWQLYPLSKTPLKLLLSEHIDLTGSMVKSVKEAPDLITIVLGDQSIFGNSTITMMFDPATYDLKQWTITDAQGKQTTVMIYDVKTGVQLASSLFRIPTSATAISPRQ